MKTEESIQNEFHQGTFNSNFGDCIRVLSNACSKGKSPIEPAMNDEQIMSQDLPDSFGTQYENRTTLAAYEAVIDPAAKTFTITPLDRSSQYHFPLTNLYPNVLQITDYGWTPNFWADIKLTHPYPGSGIDAFDPRVIAILPAKPGVSMNYPIFNVQANNSVILEPDGYTKLFDWVAGSIPGNTNPFMAYFKDEPYRVWSSTGTTEETQKWQMDFSGFDGPLWFVLVVDVSTNYQKPSEPIADNAPEPVEIKAEIGCGLIQNGGEASVEARIKHWKDIDDIGGVTLESPDLINDTLPLQYYSYSPYYEASIFKGTLANENLAPVGDYNLLIKSWDNASGIRMFNEFSANVDYGINFDPVDITPPWLNLLPQDVCIDGNYAYIAGGVNGLHIFNISNPLNPVWINQVDTPDFAIGVFVTDGYAYVAGHNHHIYYSGLQIIDVDPPESAYIVNSVATPGLAEGIYVTGGYAYVADESSGLQIIDIDPPESAYIVNSVNTLGDALGVYVTGGYAYVVGSGLKIIDIDPPELATIVKSIDTSNHALDVFINNGYAFVVNLSAGLVIIDVDPIGSASIVKTVDTTHEAWDVYVTGGYAYVADNESGLQIIDIDPIGSANIVKSVDTPSHALGVYVTGGYAYVADDYSGLQVIDVDPPESANIVKSVDTPGYAWRVHVTDDYAYVANRRSGLNIIDIDPPESASIVKTIGALSDYTYYDLHVTNGYAYVTNRYRGLLIIDVDPPESAYIVNAVDAFRPLMEVYVTGGYAYVTADSLGLQIIDVDPPESASIVKSVNTPHEARDVYVTDSYAYVACSNLQIIDVDPPESASIVKTVDTFGARYIYVTGGYAYVVGSELQIIDIDPLESASIVKSVFIPDGEWGVYVIGGYAYVANGYSGLQIVDVDPPESAYIVTSVDTPGEACDVFVADGYAYVANRYGGLRIIDLW